jgi:O-antigen/teichoic acid export membrane protein
MSNATEMAKISAKGGFHLLWGLVLSTVISAVGTIVIAILLGADNYGLYTIAIAAPNLIAAFRDWGITNAMIKFTAQYNNEGSIEKVRSIFYSGLIFELLLGSLLSVISFLLSGFLAGIFSRPEIAPLIQIASFSVLTHALISLATATFTGMERMHMNSFMLTIQSLVKTGLIIGFVVLGAGNVGAVGGFMLGTLVAGVIGLVFVWTMLRSLGHANSKLKIFHTVKYLLKYGFPLSIGTILTVFLTQFYTYAMAIYVIDNYAIGNYSVASNFVVLITFFATPVATMLFPAFSKIDYRKDVGTLQSVFQYSVKYSSLVVVPVTALIMVLSEPAIKTIFANGYNQAPLFLSLSSILYLYCAFGSLSVPSLINGQGHTTFNLKLTVLTVAIGFSAGFLFVSQLGLIGLIITTLIAGLPSLIISLFFIKKQYGLSLDWYFSIKIFFSTGFAAFLTFLVISNLRFASVITLFFGIFVFVFLLIPMLIITHAVNRVDLANLREIAGALGPLSKMLGWIITVLAKIMSILKIN